MKKFYITTTLPYVNAAPHIGFAAEIARADAIARYQKILGKDVFFNTGTDEHGLKIFRKSKEEGKDIQDYVNEYAAKFDNLKKALNLSYNSFTRTSDQGHTEAAREFWRLCDKAGDIYKKEYRARYCVGCEAEKTDSELVEGKCPDHPGQELEIIEEENYFFRFSNYSGRLLEFYENNPNFVIPKHRLNEIKKFVERGLEDFSISRLKEKMPWGIPVPGDNKHVMYVWFDALVNYISCLGWPKDEAKFNDFWPGTQVAGKDNLRFQTAMWQAMLMSAGLPNSSQVLIFGFITADGRKMSKSLGNVVSPYDLVERYGSDATRYYMLADLAPYEDSDYTMEKFESRYAADLVNGVGNLVSRSVTLTEKMYQAGIKMPDCVMRPADKETFAKWGGQKSVSETGTNWGKYIKSMDKYDFNMAGEVIMAEERYLDNYITENEPWKLIKEQDGKVAVIMYNILERLRHMALMLWPFMPETAEEIWRQLGLEPSQELAKEFNGQIKFGLLPANPEVSKGRILFPRISGRDSE